MEIGGTGWTGLMEALTVTAVRYKTLHHVDDDNTTYTMYTIYTL